MAKEFEDYFTEEMRESPEPQEWLEAQLRILSACLHLGANRHEAYGPGNIQKFGVAGTIIRMTDKLERLSTMVFQNGDTDNARESILDSFSDLVNYGLYSLMLLQKTEDGKDWWSLPYRAKDINWTLSLDFEPANLQCLGAGMEPEDAETEPEIT